MYKFPVKDILIGAATATVDQHVLYNEHHTSKMPLKTFQVEKWTT